MRKTWALGALLVLGSVQIVHAGLIVNPSFEGGGQGFTAAIPNWTVVRTTGGGGGWCISPTNSDAHTGTCAADFTGPNGGFDTISQTLATAPGTLYTLTFWILANSGPGGFTPNELQVRWDGNTVLDIVNFASPSYVQQSVNVLATTGSTVLQFAGFDSPSFLFIDDVDLNVASSVPEPSTLIAAGLALGLVFAARVKAARVKQRT